MCAYYHFNLVKCIHLGVYICFIQKKNFVRRKHIVAKKQIFTAPNLPNFWLVALVTWVGNLCYLNNLPLTYLQLKTSILQGLEKDLLMPVVRSSPQTVSWLLQFTTGQLAAFKQINNETVAKTRTNKKLFILNNDHREYLTITKSYIQQFC